MGVSRRVVAPILRVMTRALLVSTVILVAACAGRPRPGDDGALCSSPTGAGEAPASVDDQPRPGAQAEVEAASADPVASPNPWEAEDVFTAVSKAGTYTVHWRPVGGPIRKNEPFEVDVWVFRNDPDGGPAAPVTGALVILSGWMPDHGHGLIRRPQSTDNGDGSYRVRGMLLHMGGDWQVFVDLIVDFVAERAEYALTL